MYEWNSSVNICISIDRIPEFIQFIDEFTLKKIIYWKEEKKKENWTGTQLHKNFINEVESNG